MPRDNVDGGPPAQQRSRRTDIAKKKSAARAGRSQSRRALRARGKTTHHNPEARNPSRGFRMRLSASRYLPLHTIRSSGARGSTATPVTSAASAAAAAATAATGYCAASAAPVDYAASAASVAACSGKL
jgi:hypothetical protein